MVKKRVLTQSAAGSKKKAVKSQAQDRVKKAPFKERKGKQVEKAEPSKTQLKKKEYQKRKYNKGDKNTNNDDEDDDFEIVSTTGGPGLIHSDHDATDSDDSDLEADMFSTIGSTKGMSSSQSIKPSLATPSDIAGSESEASDSEEEKFIAKENLAANRKNKKSGGFQSMGLTHPVYKAILHKGFKVPTPIQRKCIPLIMEQKDVVGMARTGSGKTAAFLIPMLERLKEHSAKVGARALLLSPSRELALQTQKVCKELGKYMNLRSCVLVGGDSLDDQFSMISSNPDILIATPGRLLHLIIEMDLDLHTIEYVVFDEADRLFEMGFAVQLHEILARLPPSRQSLLFSATLPKLLVDFAKAGLEEPTLVRLDVDTKISKDLEMAFFSIKDSEKEAALLYLLRSVIHLPKTTSHQKAAGGKKKARRTVASEKDRQTILFVATKHHVEYLASVLSTAGYQVSYVYGSLDQTARNIQIDNFRSGITNLLVVTDVAARGIDIPILENVINYDFCGSSKVFVHRVGRAARAGRRGWAFSLIAPDELPYLVDLELFLTRPLQLGKKPTDNIDYTSELVLGALPQGVLQDDIAWVKDLVETDAALHGTATTANNAYKLYNRTKPRAAPESYTRAKALMKRADWKTMHPLLVNDENNSKSEKERLAMIEQISGFRPHETVFEVGQRGSRKINEATMIMRQRRATVGKTIEAYKSQSVEGEAAAKQPVMQETSSSSVDLGGEVGEDELLKAFRIPTSASKRDDYRDKEFYISYTQQDANTERGYSMTNTGNFTDQAQKAQLDLVGDDNDTMQQKRNQLRWDSKKHNFVRGSGIGADNKKLIRTESGALISASFKSGRFQEWSKKTRIAMPRAGELELSTGARHLQQKRFRHSQVSEAKPLDPLSHDYERKVKKQKRNNEETGQGKRSAPDPKRKVQSELKNAGQIRKARIEKEKKREKTGRTPKKKGRRP